MTRPALLFAAVLLAAMAAPPPAPDWSVSGSQAGQYLGASMATGDFNGDGFPDLALGSPTYTDGAFKEGAVFVHYGGASGPSPTAGWWNAPSDDASAGFGRSIASPGDLNGDGIDDLAVGAPTRNTAATPTALLDTGAVYVYHGSPAGLPAQPTWSIAGKDRSRLGASLAGGDINGDGLGDLVMGAPGLTTGDGAAYAIHGRQGGLAAVTSVDSADWIEIGLENNAGLGACIEVVGDVNDDGIDDVLVGAPGSVGPGGAPSGAVYLFPGGPLGLPADWTWGRGSPVAGAGFGAAAAAAGDVDGDGVDDLLIGAPFYDDPTGVAPRYSGAVFVYRGPLNAPQALPFATFLGGQIDSYYGASVMGLGDIDGNGVDDIAIGAEAHDAGAGGDEGAVFIHLGYPGSVSLVPDLTYTGDVSGLGVGTCLRKIGDLYLDGHPDLALGLPYQDRLNTGATDDAGGVRIYNFRPSPPDEPSAAVQLLSTGAPFPIGGTLDGPQAVIEAVVSDPDLGQLKLELEFKAHPQAFDGTGLLQSPPAANGTPARISVGPLAPGTAHHWRIRTVDPSGLKSAWWEAGGNSPTPDLVVRADTAPSVTAPQQLSLATGASMGAGARFSAAGVRFRLDHSDAQPDSWQLAIEVRRTDQPLTGSATVTSAVTPPGQAATVDVILPLGDYHWAYWAVEATPFALSSPRVSFGSNADGEADFKLLPDGSRNLAAGCGQGADSEPPRILLMLAAAAGFAFWINRARPRTPTGKQD